MEIYLREDYGIGNRYTNYRKSSVQMLGDLQTILNDHQGEMNSSRLCISLNPIGHLLVYLTLIPSGAKEGYVKQTSDRMPTRTFIEQD